MPIVQLLPTFDQDMVSLSLACWPKLVLYSQGAQLNPEVSLFEMIPAAGLRRVQERQ